MFVLFLFYLFISVLADDDSDAIQSRILYGQNVKIEDHPYYAGLLGCGAAIISDVWILTAAHCVTEINMKVQNYLYVGGETFDNSKVFPYNKIIIHEDYNEYLGLPLNDVALIKLSAPLPISKKIGIIKLPRSTSFNKNILFVGRGRDETGKLSKNLQKVDLVRLTPSQCIDLIPKEILASYGKQTIQFLKKTNICAKRATNMPTICNCGNFTSSACRGAGLVGAKGCGFSPFMMKSATLSSASQQGDSGSPLVSGDTLIGLASYVGNKDCAKLRLGFYVNIQYYIPWIKKHTGL